MDEHQIEPGDVWMQELQGIIGRAPAAAVFLGASGLGKWQKPEIEACIDQNTEREMPVIPVPLPGFPDGYEMPPFLKRFSWIDLRKNLPIAELERLAEKVRPRRTQSVQDSSRQPFIHNLPYLPLGDLLKGRDDDLQKIESSLGGPAQATAITQTLHGLGGIGKTRLAVEYAWRSRDRYDFALFVVAETPEGLRSGLAGLTRLGLPGLSPSPSGVQEEDFAAVLHWLRGCSRWLLVLDNVDTEDAAKAVKEIAPQLRTGHVLITSRLRKWPPGFQKQELGVLSQEEAVQFLLQRTEGERSRTGQDAEQADRLAEILGGLPLALEQAAAYIGHHQTTFAKYLESWEKEREDVLTWHDEDMQYPASVATTWQTTFRQLTPKAAALLRLTAFLAPEPIPSAMFEEGAEFVEAAEKLYCEETGESPVARSIKNVLSELAAYSLIARDDDAVIVHRIVQEVLRARIPEERRKDWLEQSLQMVNQFAAGDPQDVRTWPAWDAIRPHAVLVIQYAETGSLMDPTSSLSSLMDQLGQLFFNKGLYNQAEPLMRRALDIDEQAFEKQHPNVALHLNNLAQLLQATNRLEEAESLMRRALNIDEQAFGNRHPIVARDLNNLAALLHETNRLSEAEPLMRRALDIDEQAFGNQHPNVAIRLNNLASLLQDTNRLSEAEPLMRRALDIDEQAFGSHHPDVAIDLNNLASLLQATNRLAEAEPLMKRAVEICQASLGADHPKTLMAQRNLASLLAEIDSQDTPASAEP